MADNGTLELIVPGEPVGKQRPKVFPIRTRTGLTIRRGVTPEKTVSYETLIRELFAVRYPGFEPLEGPLVLTIEAFLGIPKSVSQKKRAAMESGEVLPEKRPDFDNLAKIAADALQGFAFRNDSQIADALIRKRYSATPRMRIVIELLARSGTAGGKKKAQPSPEPLRASSFQDIGPGGHSAPGPLLQAGGKAR
jgi:Holliday junction resolvase RusA-like endonuclease